MMTKEVLMKQRADCLEFSMRLNMETHELDGIALVEKMNAQRNKLMDYIKMLEQYIGEHEGTWQGKDYSVVPSP